MKGKYTACPWAIATPASHGTSVYSKGAADVSVAWFGAATVVGNDGSYAVSAAETERNARRAVLCVNLCDGLTSDQIAEAIADYKKKEVK